MSLDFGSPYMLWVLSLSSLYSALVRPKISDSKGGKKELIIKYEDLGCWKDRLIRAIPSLEDSFKSPLDRNYRTRLNPLFKCARIAKLKGLPGFALENGGQCFGSINILKTYKTYGKNKKCTDSGKGGPWSLNVYRFV